MNSKKRFNTATFARTAMMSALAMILSFVEGMLPELPIPGAKLGLSNLAVMTATGTDGIASGLCVAVFKAFFALITRGPVAGTMSLCGGVLSTFVMWLVMRFDRNKFGYVGVGVIGAVSHNIGQLAVAFVIMGNAVRFYVPFLIIVATVTGTFTGIVNSILLPTLKKLDKNGI